MPHLTITKESEELPVKLEEIKLFLRVDYEEDDKIIERLFRTALKQAELFINQTIAVKSYKCVFSKCSSQIIHLLYGPVQEITSISAIQNNGEERIMTGDDYVLDKGNDTIKFKYIPSNFTSLMVSYSAGYDKIPDDLLQALLIHTAKLFEDKTGYSKIPATASYIYRNYKKIKL